MPEYTTHAPHGQYMTARGVRERILECVTTLHSLPSFANTEATDSYGCPRKRREAHSRNNVVINRPNRIGSNRGSLRNPNTGADFDVGRPRMETSDAIGVGSTVVDTGNGVRGANAMLLTIV